MCLEFFTSVFQTGVKCGGSRLTQTAGRCGSHSKGQAFQTLKIFFCCKSCCKFMQDHVHLTVTFTAWNTFTTAFMDKEFRYLLQVINDAYSIVQYNYCTGTDAQSLFFQGSVVITGIQLFWETDWAGLTTQMIAFTYSLK